MRRPWPLIVAICILLLAGGGLGWWWWSLRSGTDPVDADPVDGYAVVVSSHECPGNGMLVELQAPAPVQQVTIDGCGQPEGRRLAVEYLRSDPTQARLAGTTTARQPGPERWLPLGILAAGVLAVGAILFLVIERRIHRKDSTAPVSVDELRRRMAEPSATVVAGPGAEPDAGAEPVVPEPESDVDEPVTPADSGRDLDSALTDTDVLHLDLGADDPSAYLPPSSPEPDLFTHRGPEPGDDRE